MTVNQIESGTDTGDSASSDTTEKSLSMAVAGQGRKKFFVCAIGVFVSYFYYGILQESITKGKYGEGEKSEKFRYVMSLVLLQTIINSAFAKGAMMLFSRESDTTPGKYYAVCSITYLGAMLASNQALQYVSYPTQVLGKSAKPIPVMVLGILLAKKRYPTAKFLFILMICLGVSLFLYKDQQKASVSEDKPIIGVGEILLLVSLTLDGLTGASQDRMRAEYKTGAYQMMLHVNLWSVLWLAIATTASGEVIQVLGFIQRYPAVLLKMVSFGLASAVGQVFIFITVTSFGPLPCSIITTTRKFFTILASVIIFANPMNSRQWVGTVLVFTGLGLDSVYGKEKKENKGQR